MANFLQTETETLDLATPAVEQTLATEVQEKKATGTKLDYDKEAKSVYLQEITNEQGLADHTLLGADSDKLHFLGCIFDNYHMSTAHINNNPKAMRGAVVGYRFRWTGEDALPVSQSVVKSPSNAYKDSKFTDPENTPDILVNPGEEVVLSRFDLAALLANPRFNGRADGGIINETLKEKFGKDYGVIVSLVIKVSDDDKFSAKKLGTPSLNVTATNLNSFEKGSSLTKEVGEYASLKFYGESIAEVASLETKAEAGVTPVKPEFAERFSALSLATPKKAPAKAGEKEVGVNRHAMRMNFLLKEKGITISAQAPKKAPKKKA